MRVSATAGAALLLALAMPTSAPGADGTYDVVFCHELNRTFGGAIESTNSFSAHSRCRDPDQDSAVQIDNTDRTMEGRSARAFWEVTEPLGISGVEVEGRLRRADGYRSELFMADATGDSTQAIASGDTSPSDFKTFTWEGKPQRQFVASLQCRQSPSCAESAHAKTWVRSVRFTVTDSADPEVNVEGSLVGGGWLRGSQTAALEGVDRGAGVSNLSVHLDDHTLVSHHSLCAGELSNGLASLFQPCPAASDSITVHDTNAPPFTDGVHAVDACAADFAGNRSCTEHEIRIDNESPALVFNAQDADDPELIRVSVHDAHSGLATGAIFYRLAGTTDWRPLFTQKVGSELRARVDSAAEMPGTYEFMATATDVAGNASEMTLREDGMPMTLDFPLRSGVELDAHIKPGGSTRTLVRYGKSASVHGRLTDAAGQPLVNAPIMVDEDFGEGALIEHRLRTVTTDEEGRWSSRLPAGPTRSVSATYEGDQRYLETGVNAGRMAVRTGAKLGLTRRHVPEGNSTTFTGRVERLGARIPSRGKVVQIQYQDPASGRWATVRNPFRTRSDGRFRFKYRFGTHYVQDVGIRFRLKVPSEQGWPYRGTQTGARRVIVEARR